MPSVAVAGTPRAHGTNDWHAAAHTATDAATDTATRAAAAVTTIHRVPQSASPSAPLARLLASRPVADAAEALTRRWWASSHAAYRDEPAAYHRGQALARQLFAPVARDDDSRAARAALAELADASALATRLGVATRFADAHAAAGALVGAITLGYTLWLAHQAAAQGLHRVVFVSREGATLARAYRHLRRALRAGGTKLSPSPPPGVYLPASRLATYLPSVDAVGAHALDAAWRQYPAQTLGNALRTLGLVPGEAGARALELVRDAGSPATDPSAAALGSPADLERVFADAVFHDQVTRRRDAARAALLALLATSGVSGANRVGIADVGWRGTIQSALQQTLELGLPDAAGGRPELVGLYLGVRAGGGDEAASTPDRSGYLASERADAATTGYRDWPAATVFACGSLFEIALSVPHRCVWTYGERRGSAGGVPRAVLLPDDDETFARLNREEARIQRGPARLVRAACLATLRVGIARYATLLRSADPGAAAGLLESHAGDLRAWGVRLLRREMNHPRRDAADAFLEHGHIETFGVYQPSRFDFVTPWREVLVGPAWHWPHRTRVALEAHFWPAGIVARSGVPLANVAWDAMLTRRAIRAGRAVRAGGR